MSIYEYKNGSLIRIAPITHAKNIGSDEKMAGLFEYENEKRVFTHCPSCGAPLNHSKDRCEYCGTGWR